MAAFRCVVFISPSTLLPSYSTGRRISLKVIRCSSVSTPLSWKSSKRKNYLRPKILRTLNPKPQESVLIGIETARNVPPSDVISNQADDVEELQVSSSSIVSNNISSKLSPKLVAKYGLYLIGIFAFQTVCAVLFLGNSTKSPEISSDNVDRGKSSRSLSLNLNGNGQNGRRRSNVVLVDELEMNEKIAEIRVMAREARKSEEKKGEDETLNPGVGIEIEKEIEARLSKMEKRLNSQRKGLAGLRVESRKGDLKDEMFEKKYKFKAEKPPMGNVKGFGGNNELMSETDKGRTGQNGQEDSNMISGAAEERRLSNQVNKSRKSGKPNMEAGRKEKKMWWMKLPYVLRIVMRSNIDQQVSEGYFSVRIEEKVSHMIAFEDHKDARNLSYLLESFFEDLNDFSAHVVPVTTKDLEDEVSCGGKNVIVVKKRQLTLYAGQAFEDVERALHTLIQQQ